MPDLPWWMILGLVVMVLDGPVVVGIAVLLAWRKGKTDA